MSKTGTVMEFPMLSPGQFAVLQSEVETEIVLTIEGDRYLGIGEVFMFFDSLQSAREFSMNKVSKFLSVECHIYSESSDNKEIETIRNKNHLLDKQ
jgi:hypothetical protein